MNSHRSAQQFSFSSLLIACTRKKMVAKNRVAVIAALSMLLLLMLSRPSHQQFFSHSCDCYRECYLGCKNAFPMLCKAVCGGSCNDNKDPVVTCMAACHTDSICGLPPAPSASAPDCMHACTKMWGGHGPAKEH